MARLQAAPGIVGPFAGLDVPDFKVPREVRLVDELPRSTLEKVAKAELRKLVRSSAAPTAAKRSFRGDA
jgi:acyl-CoA synthetase (AMP-forming)/AMP-acid ligase II